MRSLVFISSLVCTLTTVQAEEPSAGDREKQTIVFADSATAQRMTCLLEKVSQAVVLIDAAEVTAADSTELQQIETRALAFRGARYFLYSPQHESFLQAMYRQRFESQGATSIPVLTPSRLLPANNPSSVEALLAAIELP